MTQSDKKEFRDLMTGLGSVFDRAIDATTLSLYWQALKHLPMDVVRGRVAHWAASARWFPRPVEVMPGSTKDDARAAWHTVVRAIRLHGAYKTVHFADPRTGAAVEQMGGWRHLCSVNSDALHAFESKKFEALYTDLLQPNDPGPLRGIHRDADPVLIVAHDGTQLPIQIADGAPDAREAMRRLNLPEPGSVLPDVPHAARRTK